MREGQDRDFIEDQITDQFLLHGWVAELMLLLQNMNTQHGGERIRRTATDLAYFGIARLDQVHERLPGHHHFPLREKLLQFGLLLGGGEFLIRQAELLTIHQTNPCL